MVDAGSHHDSVQRTDTLKPGSNRSFGMVFACLFAVVALYPLLFGSSARWWSLYLAATLALIALARPATFTVPNHIWHRFGLLLHQVVSPVSLGLIFYLAVTPTALILRLLRRDPLRLRLDRAAQSYWIVRSTDRSDRGDMRRQF